MRSLLRLPRDAIVVVIRYQLGAARRGQSSVILIICRTLSGADPHLTFWGGAIYTENFVFTRENKN